MIKATNYRVNISCVIITTNITTLRNYHKPPLTGSDFFPVRQFPETHNAPERGESAAVSPAFP